MSLGAELRRARQEAGLSQEWAAFAAGVDRSYLSQLEFDCKSLTVDTLLRICEAIGVKTSVLLARVERTRPRTEEG